MKNTDQDIIGRRSIVTGLGVAAASLAAAGSASAQTQQTSAFKPARHKQDAWMDEIPGSHRAFLDSDSASGGAAALRYGFNILSAQENAYEGSAADFAMIVCFRHSSTPFGFNDAMWEKYGEQFNGIMDYPDPSTGQAPSLNLLNQGNGPITIKALAARGVHFAICATATRFFSSSLAASTGRAADEVFAELSANIIPNGRFVPAGVIALTRAQEYHYSFLYAG